jgi:hypothetical protein
LLLLQGYVVRMPTQEYLPLVERQAARAAIEQIVQTTGSQSAAGNALGVSQNAINKAVLYTRIGPAVLRAVLDHLELDVKQLVARYGDPSHAGPHHAAPAAPRSSKEEAILAGVRYGGVREADARAIADEYEAVLKDAPLIEWVETMLGQIQKRHLLPGRQEKAADRRRKSQQRVLSKLHDAHAAKGEDRGEAEKKKGAAR